MKVKLNGAHKANPLRKRLATINFEYIEIGRVRGPLMAFIMVLRYSRASSLT
jgi:hypothetical protein